MEEGRRRKERKNKVEEHALSIYRSHSDGISMSMMRRSS